MSKEIQNIKKRLDCDQNCQTCNILNIAQRRIGNGGYTRDWNYLGLGKDLANERCPEGNEMKIRLLHPTKTRSRNENGTWVYIRR